jgi:hypothetical protein
VLKQLTPKAPTREGDFLTALMNRIQRLRIALEKEYSNKRKDKIYKSSNVRFTRFEDLVKRRRANPEVKFTGQDNVDWTSLLKGTGTR